MPSQIIGLCNVYQIIGLMLYVVVLHGVAVHCLDDE